MQIESCLLFNSRCEEAIEFCKRAPGAEADRFGVGWMASVTH